jgi:predicted nucleic acid-binding Zn ribbon protein
MPTYVYKFIDTGENIEVQQAFTDDALTHAEHPGTGKTMQVKKVFTPVGVTFKGGGFYKTDSRGGKSKSSSSTTSSSESGSSSDSSKSDSSKSDSSKSSSTESNSSSTTSTATPAAPAKTATSSD